MMIWPTPETLVSRRTVSERVNPRAIDPLDEEYSDGVAKSSKPSRRKVNRARPH
jgi:hypothetical protein